MKDATWHYFRLLVENSAFVATSEPSEAGDISAGSLSYLYTVREMLSPTLWQIGNYEKTQVHPHALLAALRLLISFPSEFESGT